MHKEKETVGLMQETKKELWEKGHPVLRQLREVKGIYFEETLPPSVLSLKELFRRRQMDACHIDCLVLYKIALGILRILKELSQRHIYPGLIDLGDCYVDARSRGSEVFIANPWRFQLLQFEQDYEWFPEDERLLGDVELFDEISQKKADTRLLYKILVASARGNVKIPPKITEADYSELFYRTLPDEWKQIFEGGMETSYEEMEGLLLQSIEMEECFAREAKEKAHEKAEQKIKEETPPLPRNVGQHLYGMFVLLRTETEEAGIISRLLYQKQDEVEMEAVMAGVSYAQAFVYGNGAVAVREFSEYPVGFRCQCEQQIKEYSAGEALIVAADTMICAMESHRQAEYRMYIITDGKWENDKVFQTALLLLEQAQSAGMKLFLTAAEDSRCEACTKLQALAQNQEEENAVAGHSTVPAENGTGI